MILGQLLVQSGCLDAEELEVALVAERPRGERIGETLVRSGITSEGDVARALSVQLGLDYAEPPLTPDREALRSVRPELARAHRILPISVNAREVRVCMADPLDIAAVDDLQFQTGRRVRDRIRRRPSPTCRGAAGYRAQVSWGCGPRA
jgi:type IV pilus assembly protein PilB